MLFSIAKAAGLVVLLAKPILASPTYKTYVPSYNTTPTPEAEVPYPTNGGGDSDGCVHGPQSRGCWTDDFTIDTDMDLRWPDTGKTVKYDFVISTITLAPDGVSKDVIVVNGQFPGPTIYADWGDTIEVSVTSTLTSNGTGIHWHGIRQYKTNSMDGVGGITECPIAAGATKVYKFKATQYGTSWYHSHYSVQYGEGLVGPIIIRGPATANYDIDLGVLPFMDWFHTPIFTVNAYALHAGAPPIADNLLVNGSMTSTSGGKYAVTNLTPGKKHLLRLVNTGINNFVHVSLDGHPFQVIASDFVPIVPYTTSSIAIAIGQRYDVIIDADQPIGNYWLRVGTGGGRCDGPNANAANIRSLFHYDGANGDPANNITIALPSGCNDETNLVPYVPTTVPADTPETLTIGFNNTSTADNLVRWLINGNFLKVDLSVPTLQLVLDNNVTADPTRNLFVVGKAEEWSYWVIQQPTSATGPALPHPIHLHGHDFYILDSLADAEWSGDISRLRFDNPPRRDTAMLPAKGYLVLAFEADNPGAWLAHCHVPFHVSAGFGLQFLESVDEIVGHNGGGFGGFEEGCASWRVFQKERFPDGFTPGDTLI